MAEIRLEVRGLDKLRMDQFARDISNLREPFGSALRYLEIAMKRDTRSGKKVGGGRYQRYSPGYRAWLSASGKLAAKKWLWLGGKMLNSMKKRVRIRQAQIGYWGRSKETMLANVHQHGASFTRPAIKPKYKQALFWPGASHPVKGVGSADITIPARPFVGLRHGYIEYIRDRIMNPWLKNQARRAGIKMEG